jgi:TetR/AcrR family transcriptional regulator, cholesterol catabolism regulator
VWLQEWRYMTGEAREQFLTERRRYERRIRSLFQDAVVEGTIRSDLDIRHAVLVFLSVGNWAYTWMTHETNVDSEADALWSTLQAGLV